MGGWVGGVLVVGRKVGRVWASEVNVEGDVWDGVYVGLCCFWTFFFFSPSWEAGGACASEAPLSLWGTRGQGPRGVSTVYTTLHTLHSKLQRSSFIKIKYKFRLGRLNYLPILFSTPTPLMRMWTTITL